MSTKSWAEQALELPGEQRKQLDSALLDSLREEPEESVASAWVAEIEDRLEELDSDESSLQDWEDVEAGIRAQYALR